VARDGFGGVSQPADEGLREIVASERLTASTDRFPRLEESLRAVGRLGRRTVARWPLGTAQDVSRIEGGGMWDQQSGSEV